MMVLPLPMLMLPLPILPLPMLPPPHPGRLPPIIGRSPIPGRSPGAQDDHRQCQGGRRCPADLHTRPSRQRHRPVAGSSGPIADTRPIARPARQRYRPVARSSRSITNTRSITRSSRQRHGPVTGHVQGDHPHPDGRRPPGRSRHRPARSRDRAIARDVTQTGSITAARTRRSAERATCPGGRERARATRTDARTIRNRATCAGASRQRTGAPGRRPDDSRRRFREAHYLHPVEAESPDESTGVVGRVPAMLPVPGRVVPGRVAGPPPGRVDGSEAVGRDTPPIDGRFTDGRLRRRPLADAGHGRPAGRAASHPQDATCWGGTRTARLRRRAIPWRVALRLHRRHLGSFRHRRHPAHSATPPPLRTSFGLHRLVDRQSNDAGDCRADGDQFS